MTAAATVATRLSTATPYIKDLNTQVAKGELKVPQFQRPFVWGPEQALALLDSVAHNYPVGSLLVWRTNERLATERSIGDFTLPETDDMSPTDYILDGQQRITVLYSVLGANHDDAGFSAHYDLERETFVDSAKTDGALHIFPLRWLYQTTRLLNFRTALQSHRKADTLQARFDALIDVLTSYQIPVVTLKDLTLEQVCPIFERINSSGTPLSIFDLMVAATWSSEFDLNESTQSISDSLAPKNYDGIHGNTVLKCLAAVRDNSVNRERILALRGFRHKPVEMDALVLQTKAAMLKAVDQLVTDFKLHSLDFLPYEAHLVILTYIYANHPVLTASQMTRVRQWFWRTSFSERYRGAPDTFITKDLQTIQRFVVGHEGDGRQFGAIPEPDTVKQMIFRKNNSRSRAFSLMLAKRSPRNITNGNSIDTTDALSVYNKKQFHHIFPDAFLRRIDPAVERSYLLNYCMLSASENNFVSDQDPKEYLPRLITKLGDTAEDVFASNFLPSPESYDYSSATLASFIEARLPLITAELHELCDGNK